MKNEKCKIKNAKWESGQVKRSNGVRECRSKVIKENYTDTPIRRYTDTETHRFSDSKKAGFSLIEMMVVVVIIAIVIGGVLFYGQGTYRRTSVKNAARDVASTMRMAHSKAMTLREEYYAVYDKTNKVVWIQPALSYPPKNPEPGSERKLPKVVVIDEVIGGGASDPYHHTFTFKGTVTLTDSANEGIVKLQDTAGKVKYRVENAKATARVKIYSSW